MMAIHFLTSLALLGIAAPTVAQSPQRSERVEFSRGTSSATVRGMIRGYQSVDYIVNARAGQPMTVSLRSSNGSAYFNVLAPKGETAMFTGSVAGNRFQGRLSATGDYRVRIYLMRNAARRGERADFSLSIAIGAGNISRPERPSASARPGISGSGTPIARGNMTAFCRGEASRQYGVKPNYILTARPVRDSAGKTTISGSADQGTRGKKRFQCRFDLRDRFIDIMALTRDGE